MKNTIKTIYKIFVTGLMMVLFPGIGLGYTRHRQPPPPIATSTPTTMAVGMFNGTSGTVQVAFNGWGDSPSCFSGKTTFLYWENYGVSLDQIINGSQDSYIKSFGSQICPNTILSLFHEANGNWDSWDGTVGNNTPSKVIQAYQHIHNIIGSKVKYAWVMNNDSVPNSIVNSIVNYYPGDAYVDIVGIDGFNFGGQTFAQVFPQSLMTQESQYGRPVWLTSVGSIQPQAQFLTDLFNVKGVSGIIYFNADQFTLTSSALAQFKTHL